MKTCIRTGVFETNSSSMHSLCIAENTSIIEQPFTDKDLYQGKIHLQGGDYGWGYDELHTPLEKLNYVAQSLYSVYDDRKLQLLNDSLSLLTEKTGFEFDISNISGYIDHQSMDLIEDKFSNPLDIVNFVLDSSSIIIIDNDNH